MLTTELDGPGARRQQLSVLIVDDHPLFRLGLRYALKAEGFDVVGEACDGRQGLSACDVHRPDVVLLDVKMPEMNGIEACARIRQRYADVIVIILTTFEEPGIVQAARSAGARGYLSKETDPADLARTIHRIAAGSSANLFPQVDLPALTPRERQVLDLLAEGYSNKGIARQLELSPETVKDYLNGVYRKLGVRDRLGAVNEARDLGLI